MCGSKTKSRAAHPNPADRGNGQAVRFKEGLPQTERTVDGRFMKIVTIVGARPQFIKASVVSAALRGKCGEILVHTGQHYDANMSDVFFQQLDLPAPAYHLNVGSGTHARQTGEILMRTEEVLLKEKPDKVMVYGDTNSTLAGALAASKLHIPVAHVEAGLRSHNRRMPEEQNRILTDHISTQLFCPTLTAVEQLAAEGIRGGVAMTGDVMLDTVTHYLKKARQMPGFQKIYTDNGVQPKAYYLATLHRAETTDGGEAVMHEIFSAFEALDCPVVFPVHPRTRPLAQQVIAGQAFHNIRLIEPVGYFDMLLLTSGARGVLTDSGGLQKEAYFMETPCVTLRSETEWLETLEGGWNVLAAMDRDDILQKVRRPAPDPAALARRPFGDGRAAEKIAGLLVSREIEEGSGRSKG